MIMIIIINMALMIIIMAILIKAAALHITKKVL